MCRSYRLLCASSALLILAVLSACTGDTPTTVLTADEESLLALAVESPQAPADLATVSIGGSDVVFWPYTGSSFDGVPVDPINVIFVGQADPVQIRSALLALDGDRTAYGLPATYPFNATWSEAIGNVQTAYSELGGWTGSVIQLQIGVYDPVRAHLRLFRAGTVDGQVVTLGGAHFEALITGTTDHQVLSWEIPEYMVAVDMVRSGLLGAAPESTGVINAAPSYREIPDVIFNLLPDDLKILITGSSDPVAAPVPLVSDGMATVLTVAGTAPPVTGDLVQTLSIPFYQVIPRPFCSRGPADWVGVVGRVDFDRTGTVDAEGNYDYESHYQGHLDVTPLDVAVNPPAVSGEPFKAVVHGNQSGFMYGDAFKVQALDKRIATGPGAEMLQTILRVASEGRSAYGERSKCLSEP